MSDSDSDAPTVVSTWFGPDDIDGLHEFDYHFKRRTDGSYSRSDEIKKAMQIHRVIDETLTDLNWSPSSEAERRALLRQMIYDHFRDDSRDSTATESG